MPADTPEKVKGRHGKNKIPYDLCVIVKTRKNKFILMHMMHNFQVKVNSSLHCYTIKVLFLLMISN